MNFYVVTYVAPPADPALIAIKKKISEALFLVPDEFSEEGASTGTPENAAYYNIDEYCMENEEYQAPDDQNALWADLKEYGWREDDNYAYFKPVTEA